jgi:hypothetical protein
VTGLWQEAVYREERDRLVHEVAGTDVLQRREQLELSPQRPVGVHHALRSPGRAARVRDHREVLVTLLRDGPVGQAVSSRRVIDRGDAVAGAINHDNRCAGVGVETDPLHPVGERAIADHQSGRRIAKDA